MKEYCEIKKVIAVKKISGNMKLITKLGVMVYTLFSTK